MYANWGQRVGGYLIDYVPIFVLELIGAISRNAIIWFLVLLASLAWWIYNRCIQAGRTGQSLGKRTLHLRDVLQGPHVEVRGRILDGVLQVGGDVDAHALAFSAAARPARRPNTQHSRRELPIIRLRPCVPPAISPQANRPSMVVSERSSITRPPFW